jgi:hypothetical protein
MVVTVAMAAASEVVAAVAKVVAVAHKLVATAAQVWLHCQRLRPRRLRYWSR